MDGYTFSLERHRLLIAHEEAEQALGNDHRREALQSQLQGKLLALYAHLEGCGGVGLRAPPPKPNR